MDNAVKQITEREQPWRLVVASLTGSQVFKLPESGQIVIGSGDRADIRISEPSLESNHAAIRLSEPVELTTTGTNAKTYVDGVRVEPGETKTLSKASAIQLGNLFAYITDQEPKTNLDLLDSEAFIERAKTECRRGERFGYSVSLIRVASDTPLDLQTVAAAASEYKLPAGALASMNPREIRLMFPHCNSHRARAILDHVLVVAAGFGGQLKGDLATSPQFGLTYDQLSASVDGKIHSVKSSISGLDVGSTVVGESTRRVYEALGQVASSDIRVMLLGETGVGKEVVAENVHRNSLRKDQPFLKLNCTAFVDTLLESELFGYQKGAFTGAVADKKGLLEAADGGTVFLDEIGDMPMGTQAKLLRVLEDGKIRRVGGVKPIEIDVRVISATNVNLAQAIEQGTFRRDLFHRLETFAIHIPPLRERQDEMTMLAKHFANAVCERNNREVPSFSPDVIELLKTYSWPGNIRELRNIVERACLLATGSVITVDCLPVDRMIPTSYRAQENTGEPTQEVPAPTRSQAPHLAGMTPNGQKERDRIIYALQQTGGNQTRAAKLLGVSRRTLIKRLDKYNLPRPQKAGL